MLHEINELSSRYDGSGGYVVRWRGVEVDHYSYPPERAAEERAAAHELAGACRAIEARGEVATSGAVAWEQERRAWAADTAPAAWKAAAQAVTDRYGLGDALCSRMHLLNLIRVELTRPSPYEDVPSCRGGTYVVRIVVDEKGRRVGHDVRHDAGEEIAALSAAALNRIDDQPWRGRCVTSGLTMLDYHAIVRDTPARAAACRAAVTIVRSYASSVGDARDAVREIASLIETSLTP